MSPAQTAPIEMPPVTPMVTPVVAHVVTSVTLYKRDSFRCHQFTPAVTPAQIAFADSSPMKKQITPSKMKKVVRRSAPVEQPPYFRWTLYNPDLP